MKDAVTLYLKEVYRGVLLNDDEVCALARRRDEGDISARNELVEKNQGLVQRWARNYIRAMRHLQMIDLIQYGNIGLMRAADLYDPDRINAQTGKPFKFSTYAVWWIRQTIDRGVMNDDRDVRLPVHIHKRIRKMLRGEAEDDWQLAILTDGNHIGIRTAGPYRFEDGEVELPDEQDHIGAVEHMYLIDEIKDILEQMVEDSPYETMERNVRIYRRRMGLDGLDPVTLEECGQEVGMTRERVRQVCEEVKKQLRVRLHEYA